ncbi:hypothetical protein KFU94_00675 [Chloroflexi bacterium TSY]|nr:hypothetical protein [Chloroflexi bacterium TSY]
MTTRHTLKNGKTYVATGVQEVEEIKEPSLLRRILTITTIVTTFMLVVSYCNQNRSGTREVMLSTKPVIPLTKRPNPLHGTIEDGTDLLRDIHHELTLKPDHYSPRTYRKVEGETVPILEETPAPGNSPRTYRKINGLHVHICSNGEDPQIIALSKHITKQICPDGALTAPRAKQ